MDIIGTDVNQRLDTVLKFFIYFEAKNNRPVIASNCEQEMNNSNVDIPL